MDGCEVRAFIYESSLLRACSCAPVCPTVCVPWCLFTGHIYKVEILGTLSAVEIYKQKTTIFGTT